MTDITLESVIRINIDGDYQLVLPPIPQGTSLPHALDNQVIEEVYIICGDTLQNTTIYLPLISDFKGSWGVKIYVSYPPIGVRESNFMVTQNNPSNQDWINFVSYTSAPITGSLYFHIVSDHVWGCFNSTL